MMNKSRKNTTAVLSLLLLMYMVNAYTVERRHLFKSLVAGSSSILVTIFVPETAHAVISSKYCAYGTGDGCEDLAEGNEYIRQLQQRSATNKEAIQLVR